MISAGDKVFVGTGFWYSVDGCCINVSKMTVGKFAVDEGGKVRELFYGDLPIKAQVPFISNIFPKTTVGKLRGIEDE